MMELQEDSKKLGSLLHGHVSGPKPGKGGQRADKIPFSVVVSV